MDVLRKANTLELDPVLQVSKPVIHCEVGQPLTSAPKQVLMAAKEGLRTSKLGYTDAFGLLSLREKIAQNYKKKYNVENLNAENVIITTGSSAGFLLSFISAFDELDLVAVASCVSSVSFTFLELGLSEIF